MKLIQTSGKRKKAIARAVLKEGKGNLRINGTPIDVYEPRLARLKLREALILAEDYAKKADINVRVCGGGIMSQAEAARLAIARALIAFAKDKKLM